MVEVRYGQYCPVAMTAEILCTRWTMLVVRELLDGSTRFNDLRRGVPRMSPGLLSQRLRELEEVGIVARVPMHKGGELYEYQLTEPGRELASIVSAFGAWGQTWIDEQAAVGNADVETLMWHMQHRVVPAHLPRQSCVVNFLYKGLPSSRSKWWLVFGKGDEPDLCRVDPGLDVDLYVATDLKTMNAVWLGLAPVKEPQESGALLLTGDRDLAETMPNWLGLSPVAGIPKRGGVRAA